jgi:hypothetical protein
MSSGPGRESMLDHQIGASETPPALCAYGHVDRLAMVALASLVGCLLRGRPRGVSSQALELRKRKIGITPFDCPCDNS